MSKTPAPPSFLDTIPADTYVREFRLLEVVDGDTVEIIIDQGMGDYTAARVRLLFVDTQEMNTDAGKAWKKTAQQWFDSFPPQTCKWFSSKEKGTKFYVQTFKYKTDKYQRYLATVYAVVGSIVECLNAELLKAGAPASPW